MHQGSRYFDDCQDYDRHFAPMDNDNTLDPWDFFPETMTPPSDQAAVREEHVVLPTRNFVPQEHYRFQNQSQKNSERFDPLICLLGSDYFPKEIDLISAIVEGEKTNVEQLDGIHQSLKDIENKKPQFPYYPGNAVGDPLSSGSTDPYLPQNVNFCQENTLSVEDTLQILPPFDCLKHDYGKVTQIYNEDWNQLGDKTEAKLEIATVHLEAPAASVKSGRGRPRNATKLENATKVNKTPGRRGRPPKKVVQADHEEIKDIAKLAFEASSVSYESPPPRGASLICMKKMKELNEFEIVSSSSEVEYHSPKSYGKRKRVIYQNESFITSSSVCSSPVDSLQSQEEQRKAKNNQSSKVSRMKLKNFHKEMAVKEVELKKTHEKLLGKVNKLQEGIEILKKRVQEKTVECLKINSMLSGLNDVSPTLLSSFDL